MEIRTRLELVWSFFGEEAEEKILRELKGRISVFDFGKRDDGTYFIDGCGIEPFFTMEFSFASVAVEWDEYRKKAWYELHRQYRFELVLDTVDGDKKVNVTIECHDEDIYRKGILEKAPTVCVGINYAGKELWGRGSDDFWIDAFADLQRQLPNNVRIKCCLTCRHGNLCPIGNELNELFCTKDVVITQKSDLYFYTEDKSERKKRTRQYCHVCADYQMQCDGCYTYNDFLHFLRQK